MGFLIAEVTIMLIVAAGAGAGLAYWWVRRQFRDATTEFHVIQAKLAASEEALSHARQQPIVDLPQAQEALDLSALDELLSELRDAQNARIRAVEGQLRTLSRQLQEALPHPMDSEDLARRLDTLRAAMPQPRLGGVESRLNRLEAMIGAVCEHVGAAIPSATGYSNAPDTNSVLPTSASSTVPPASGAPAGMSSQAPRPPGTVPSRSASSLQSTSTQVTGSSPPVSSKGAEREPGANLLHKPTFGTPDNLKRISGVGPKLENLLHRLGVYYYWQISEWTAADIAYVDTRLESFKGRIRRDGWVAQAKRLSAEPNASQGPNVATSRASTIRALDGDHQQSTG